MIKDLNDDDDDVSQNGYKSRERAYLRTKVERATTRLRAPAGDSYPLGQAALRARS